jgi:hypothetical protein
MDLANPPVLTPLDQLHFLLLLLLRVPELWEHLLVLGYYVVVLLLRVPEDFHVDEIQKQVMHVHVFFSRPELQVLMLEYTV